MILMIRAPTLLLVLLQAIDENTWCRSGCYTALLMILQMSVMVFALVLQMTVMLSFELTR